MLFGTPWPTFPSYYYSDTKQSANHLITHAIYIYIPHDNRSHESRRLYIISQFTLSLPLSYNYNPAALHPHRPLVRRKWVGLLVMGLWMIWLVEKGLKVNVCRPGMANEVG